MNFTTNAIRVCIKSALVPSLWYAKQIGVEHFVVPSLESELKLLYPDSRIIHAVDCIILHPAIDLIKKECPKAYEAYTDYIKNKHKSFYNRSAPLNIDLFFYYDMVDQEAMFITYVERQLGEDAPAIYGNLYQVMKDFFVIEEDRINKAAERLRNRDLDLFDTQTGKYIHE